MSIVWWNLHPVIFDVEIPFLGLNNPPGIFNSPFRKDLLR